MRRTLHLALLVAVFLPVSRSIAAQDPAFGEFSGNPKAEWSGRTMYLLEDFSYRKNPGLSLEAIEAFNIEGLESQASDPEMQLERERIDYDLVNGTNRSGLRDIGR